MIWVILSIVLYYMPLIIGILATVHLLIKNIGKEIQWSTLFIGIVLSVIPLVNIVYAAFLLDELE